MAKGVVFTGAFLFCLAINALLLYGQNVLAHAQISTDSHEQKLPEIRHFDDSVLVFFYPIRNTRMQSDTSPLKQGAYNEEKRQRAWFRLERNASMKN